MERPFAPAPAMPQPPTQSPSRGLQLLWPVGMGVLLLAGSLLTAEWMLHSFSHADDGAAGSAAATGKSAGPKGAAIAYVDVEGGVSHLYPIHNGRVTALPVKEGDPVKKGDVLLQVDDKLDRIRLAEAEIAVEVARKQLEQAEDLVAQHAKQIEAQQAAVDAARCKVESAQARAAQVKRYLDKGISGSPEDVTVAEKMVKEAQAAVHAEQAKLAMIRSVRPKTAADLARLDVQAKEEQVEKAEYAVRECKIVAPDDGFLLRKTVSVGDVLGPNPQTPALIFRPKGPLIIRAEVEQEFAGDFADAHKQKGRVRITDELDRKTSIDGTIQSVSEWIAQRRSVLPEPRQFNDIRTLEVVIKPKSEDGLRIGQRVRVELGSRPGN